MPDMSAEAISSLKFFLNRQALGLFCNIVTISVGLCPLNATCHGGLLGGGAPCHAVLACSQSRVAKPRWTADSCPEVPSRDRTSQGFVFLLIVAMVSLSSPANAFTTTELSLRPPYLQPLEYWPLSSDMTLTTESISWTWEVFLIFVMYHVVICEVDVNNC